MFSGKSLSLTASDKIIGKLRRKLHNKQGNSVFNVKMNLAGMTRCSFYKSHYNVVHNFVTVRHIGPGRTRANFVYFQFLASKTLAKISQVPNLAVVPLDEHVLTKTSLIDIYVTRSTDEKQGARVNWALDFMQE